VAENNSVALLELIPCFASLSPEAVEYLQGTAKELSFNKAETIILEGEPCPGLFVVKSGAVKLYRVSTKGEERIVRIIHRRECFECVPLFDGGGNPVSAEALKASTLYFLPASAFTTLLSTYPQAVSAFAAILARRLRSLVNLTGDFSTRKVYPRLARILYQLSEQQGQTVTVAPTIRLNQQHLGCMLGCSRQAVNASLRKLVQAGFIKMEGHHIVILDHEALRRVS
tara:strand:- start:2832 stop:3512 length:681 start_codon:yes stop_codon:yes gene_type:complete